MKIIISSLLLISVLFSCTSNNGIILDQDTSYIIPEGYKLVDKTQNDVDYYKSFFGKTESNSMVLYKILAGSNNLIFIGVGYETSYDKIKNDILLQAENDIVLQDSIQNKSFTIIINKDSLTTITHYLTVLDSGNKYLFSILNNGEIDDSTFVEQYIKNQIIIK